MSWVKKLIEIKDGLARYTDALFDASAITSGTIDPARLPPSAGVVVASGDITTLTVEQQAMITEGTQVILSPGLSYYYKGTGSKTDLGSYIAETAVTSWDGVSSKPTPITALATLFPLADTVPYFTGTATADRMSFAEFARALVGQGTAAGWRYLLGVLSVDDALPKNNPTATGLLTAPAIRNTGGTANALIKWDADGDEVASSLSDNGTTVSGINLSASGAVDAGLSRMQSSAVSPTDQAWFGYAGKNIAGAYIGYYPDEDGAIRIAAAAGQLVSLGTGAAYGQLVISDSGVQSSSMAGTGDRGALVDSTGKFKPDPRAGVQTVGAVAVAINATTKRMLRVTGAANLQLGNPADCAEVAVKVMAAFNGNISISGNHQYSETAPDYWYYSSGERSVTVSSYGTDGYLKAFSLWCDGVNWYFQA